MLCGRKRRASERDIVEQPQQFKMNLRQSSVRANPKPAADPHEELAETIRKRDCIINATSRKLAEMHSQLLHQQIGTKEKIA
jgi:hypothetical protein